MRERGLLAVGCCHGECSLQRAPGICQVKTLLHTAHTLDTEPWFPLGTCSAPAVHSGLHSQLCSTDSLHMSCELVLLGQNQHCDMLHTPVHSAASYLWRGHGLQGAPGQG